jgi:hypothetical protein
MKSLFSTLVTFVCLLSPFRSPLRLLATFSLPTTPPQEAQYRRRAIQWRDVQSPFNPGIGAIIGGPGNAPEPGSPMYICRGQVQGSVTPGKWVKGNCNVAFGGKEVVLTQYQIAYGDALWQPYGNTTYGLLRTGTDSDGTPLFSCRVHYNPGFPQGDQGNQPGKLLNGACRIPYGGGELVIGPPFEVLSVDGGYNPPYPPPYPSPYPQPYPYPPLPTQVYPMPNPSTVTWKPAHEGDTPGPGAIEGGPGNGPEPGSPLYVCRAGVYAGGLFPGKWIQGKCSVAWDGREFKQSKYDVAYGSAVWGPFGGVITPEMVQGGYDTDQTPLYICRVTHYKIAFQGEKGNQPGYLKNGQCWIPYSDGSPNDPPFEVLFNAPAAPSAAQGDNSAPSASAGVLVSFDSGTGATPGTLVVINGATGKTVSRQLNPNMTTAMCLQVLQQAALDAGLQIQSDPQGLKLAGVNNSVQVTGANVTLTPY